MDTCSVIYSQTERPLRRDHDPRWLAEASNGYVSHMSDETNRPSDRLVTDRPGTDAPSAHHADTHAEHSEPLDTDNVEARVVQGASANPAGDIDPEAPGLPAPGAQSGS